jgi:predicted RNase H-like HicB family nuclease
MFYPACIEWSDTHSLVNIHIPDIPGAIAAASTFENALLAAQEIAQLMLQTNHSLGLSVPPPTSIHAHRARPEYAGMSWSMLDIDLSNYFADGMHTPHEVVSRIVDGATPMRAWREYLQLSEEEVARRLGVSLVVYAAHEANPDSVYYIREKVGKALGLPAEELEWWFKEDDVAE